MRLGIRGPFFHTVRGMMLEHLGRGFNEENSMPVSLLLFVDDVDAGDGGKNGDGTVHNLSGK